jgi:hypothetical protein
MKKLITIILAMIMAVCLTACEGSKDEEFSVSDFHNLHGETFAAAVFEYESGNLAESLALFESLPKGQNRLALLPEAGAMGGVNKDQAGREKNIEAWINIHSIDIYIAAITAFNLYIKQDWFNAAQAISDINNVLKVDFSQSNGSRAATANTRVRKSTEELVENSDWLVFRSSFSDNIDSDNVDSDDVDSEAQYQPPFFVLLYNNCHYNYFEQQRQNNITGQVEFPRFNQASNAIQIHKEMRTEFVSENINWADFRTEQEGLTPTLLFIDQSEISSQMNPKSNYVFEIGRFIPLNYFAQTPQEVRYVLSFEESHKFFATYNNNTKGYSTTVRAELRDWATGEVLLSKEYTTNPPQSVSVNVGSDTYAGVRYFEIRNDFKPVLETLFLILE